MDLTYALRTSGAARSFTDEAVPDETVAAILDLARFAPSGGNRQGWKVAVVQDAGVRTSMALLMQPVWNEYVAQLGTARAPFNIYDEWAPSSPVPHASNELLDNLATAPVVLVIASDLSKVTMVDKDLGRPTIIGGASVYPFCWSILLAARAHDLGGVLTTFLVRAEHEAATLLGLPPEHALCAVIVLGHPIKRTTRLTRKPVKSFTTFNRFDGPAFPSTPSAT